jgi:putative sterol carrier protein
MTDALEAALAAVRAKFGDEAPLGTYRFEIEGEGVIVIEDGVVTGASAVDAGPPADVTISATLDVFRKMFDGELSPTAAYMTGRISIDGDMGAAMKLSQYIG